MILLSSEWWSCLLLFQIWLSRSTFRQDAKGERCCGVTLRWCRLEEEEDWKIHYCSSRLWLNMGANMGALARLAPSATSPDPLAATDRLRPRSTCGSLLLRYGPRKKMLSSCDGFREGVGCPHGTSLLRAQTSVSSPSEPVFDSHLWLTPEFCAQLGN